MKLGTSLRFVFPASSKSYAMFRAALDVLPKGGFIERPMGEISAYRQGRNLIEVTVAARDAGLDMLWVGDHHAVPERLFANPYARALNAIRGCDAARYGSARHVL
jgi:hypothetical protein